MSQTGKKGMQLQFLLAAVVLFFPFSVLRAQGTPSAEALLRKMAAARQTTAYRGDWVTESDSRQVWQKIYHDSTGRKRIVFLLPRRLLGREILEIPPFFYVRKKEGEKFRKRELLLNRPLFWGGMGAKKWRLLQKNYRVSVARGQTFLRRPVWRVDFHPRFSGRPNVSAWVDARTFLLLKLEKTGSDGRMLEKSYFKNLIINPVLDPALFVLLPDQVETTDFSRASRFSSLDSLKQAVHFSLILPRWLPEGFQFQMARRLLFGGREIVHLIYFDGLTALSLFESKSPRERVKSGSISAKKHLGVWEMRTAAKNVRVALFGDLSRPVLERVLNSFPKEVRKSPQAGKNLVLWVGILIVFLVLMTQFLTGKRRTR